MKRINVVDSLRGFAVVGIILIHFLEHLNFYAFPDPTPFEQGLWDTVFYLGASKMYAVFSLLFGVSCYIQHHNEEKRGGDFRLHFAWRMLLLFGWGLLDLVFFNGDILCTYAVLGLLLIPLVKAPNWVLGLTAFVLFLQPIEIVYEIMGIIHPDTQMMDVGLGPIWGALYEPCANGSFLDVARANLTYGLQLNFGWALEHGRLTQTLCLFVIGMLVGRYRLFIDEGNNSQKWQRYMLGAILLYCITQPLLSFIAFDTMPAAVSGSLEIQLTAWRNFAMMTFYVTGITLLYYRTRARKAIDHLACIGKMSLTDYLLQSIVGGFLFYNWGLALYHVSSHGISFLLGLAFCILLYLFCRFWASHFRRGPLEELWARATWAGKRHDPQGR